MVVGPDRDPAGLYGLPLFLWARSQHRPVLRAPDLRTMLLTLHHGREHGPWQYNAPPS